MIYAALVVELLEMTTAHLVVAQLPTGVPLRQVNLYAWQVQRARIPIPFSSDDVAFYNFAGDTYVLGLNPTTMIYSLSVVSEVFGTACRVSNAEKSEVLYDAAEEERRVTTWPSAIFRGIVHTGRPPLLPAAPQMAAEIGRTMLGSSTTIPQDACNTMAWRFRSAWNSWAGVRAQIRSPRICFRFRMQLVDGVVLPTLMWGLESICLTKPQRNKLSALQGVMVSRTLNLFQKPREHGVACNVIDG